MKESEGNAQGHKNLHLFLFNFLVQRNEIYQSGNTEEFDSSFWVKLACAVGGVTEQCILTLGVLTGSQMPH